jgi:type I restriction enzyme M protein
MSNSRKKQSQELANQLWAIANDLRGNMDASKFKNYILGVIFYRFLSERSENYMNLLLKDDNISYKEALANEDYAPTIMGWSIEHLGYIIEPKHLWSSLIHEIKGNEFSIENFEKGISSLVASTIGQESEAAFDKLFDDMNLQDKDLGKEVSERTELISKVILKIDDISFNVDDAEMDVLGTAYMILISLFASDAGKKGGEFFTPTSASKLVAKLATVGLNEVNNVADSCAGSGSLLLEVQNHLSTKKVGHFYATEKIGSNYNLLRMNFLIHGIPYKKFTCYNEDSIKTDNYYENGESILFDVQVENPPYSAKYPQNSKLLEDPRFSSSGVLAPQGKADLMFVESMVYHMAEDGRIACLLPSGALFRGKKKDNGKADAEYVIRRHLIENLNVVDAIIGLPANMFHGAKLPVIILVLKKKRSGNSDNILFIDASKHFTQGKSINFITDEDIDRIIKAYVERKDIEKFARVASLDEIKEKDFNCNIPRYVDTAEQEILIDIEEQNAIIKDCDIKAAELDRKLEHFFKELGLEV